MNYCLSKYFIHFIFREFFYPSNLLLPAINSYLNPTSRRTSNKKRGFWKQMKSSLMGIKTLIIKITKDPAGCFFFARDFELF